MVRNILIALGVLAVISGGGFAWYYNRPSKRMHRSFERGMIYLQKRKNVEAAREFKTALDIDGSKNQIRFYLAEALEKSQDDDNAITELSQIVKNNPSYKDAYFPLIRLYVKKKEYAKALEVCEGYLKQNPEDVDIINQRASIYLVMRQTAKAEIQFKKSIETDPNDYRAYIGLASRVYWQEGKKEEAVKLLGDYLTKNPNSFATRLTLANLYRDDRKNQEAAKELSYLYKRHVFSVDTSFADDLTAGKMGKELTAKFQENCNPKLFTLSTSREKEFAKKKISANLKRVFNENRVNVGNNTTISVVEEGSQWQIKERLATYLVKKEDGVLNVYFSRPFTSDIKVEAVERNDQWLDQQIRFLIADAKFADDLDESKIAKELTKSFKTYGLEFSADTKVNVVDKGNRWEIEDPKSKDSYLVVKKDNVLNIYSSAWLLDSWVVSDKSYRRSFELTKGHVVSADQKYIDDLNTGELPKGLVADLKAKGLQVSDNDSVKVEKFFTNNKKEQVGLEWSITNEAGKRYLARRGVGSLKVLNPDEIAVGHLATARDRIIVTPNLALSYLASNNLRDALLTAKQGIASYSSKVKVDPRLLYVRGLGFLRERKYEEALQDLELAKKARLPIPDLYYKLSLAYYRNNKNPLAISQLREILKAAPNYLDARTLLVEILVKERQLDRAEENVDLIIDAINKIKPKTDELKKSKKQELIRFLRIKAQISVEKGESDKANAVYNEISKLDGNSLAGKLGKVQVLMRGKKYDEAIKMLKTLRVRETKELADKNKGKKPEEQTKPDPYLPYLIASNYLEKKDLENALNYINESIKLAPNALAPNLLLARVRRLQRSPALETEIYEKLFKINQNNDRLTVSLVNMYLQQNKPAKAIEALKKAGKDESEEPVFLEILAKASVLQEKDEDALRYLEQIPESKRNAAIMAMIGKLHSRLGNQEAAVRALQEADSAAGTDSPLQRSIAVPLYLDKDWQGAADSLKVHIEKFPQDQQAKIFLSIVQLGAGQQEAAEEAIVDMLDESNDEYKQYRWMANLCQSAIYVNKSEYDNARDEIKKIPKALSALRESFLSLADYCEKESISYVSVLGVLILNQMGQLDSALVQCEDCLRQINHFYPRYLKSAILLTLGKNEQGQEILEELASQANMPIYVHSRLGKLLMQQKQYKKAEGHLLKTLKGQPNAPDILMALALCYQSQKNSKKSVEYYSKVLKATKKNNKNPFTIQAYNNLAWLLVEMDTRKSIKKAIKYATEAYEIMKDQPDIVDTLGWAHFKAKQYKEAKRYLSHAHNLSPNQPSIMYHYASVLAKEKNWSGATELLEASLKENSDILSFPEIEDAKKLLKYTKKKMQK